MLRVLICLLSSLCILPSSFSAPPNLLIATGIKDLLQLIPTKPVPVK